MDNFNEDFSADLHEFARRGRQLLASGYAVDSPTMVKLCLQTTYEIAVDEAASKSDRIAASVALYQMITDRDFPTTWFEAAK